jgi:hypothetical protein
MDKIENFEERNKLPSMKSVSQDKLILARLRRMWVLANMYAAFKNGRDELLAQYQNFRTFTKVNFWNEYYEKFGADIE